MDNPLDELKAIIDLQRGLAKSMEETENHLVKARDLLNDAFRKQDEISEKELLVALITANSAMLASSICMIQNTSSTIKQAIFAQEQAIKKTQDGLSDFGKMMQDQMGGEEDQFDEPDDEDEEEKGTGLPPD